MKKSENHYASPINQRIAYYRKRAGYTQEEVAKLLEIPTKTYSYREQKGKVSGEFVNKLARLFGIPAVYILEGENNDCILPPTLPDLTPIAVHTPDLPEPPAEPKMKSTGDYIAELYNNLPRDLQFEVFDFVTNAFNRAKERDNA